MPILLLSFDSVVKGFNLTEFLLTIQFRVSVCDTMGLVKSAAFTYFGILYKCTNRNYRLKNSEKNNSQQPFPADLSRRTLLKGAGLAGAVAVSASSAGMVVARENQSLGNNSAPALEALETLTAAEAEVLEAICDCLIPSDESGPGAKEARAAHYIDRSLASHNSDSRACYLQSLTALNEQSQKNYGANFEHIARDKQEALIEALQNDQIPGCSPSSRGFFALVRDHTIDGTFCDPYYGGNRDFIGWDMLQYPGIRLSASETDVRQGSALSPNHQSAYDNVNYTKMAANIIKGQGGNRNA